MCVIPVLPAVFRPSKIELEKISKKDLANYDSIKQLAKENFCDILIEKKDNIKAAPDYNVFKIIARRRWVNPQYVFSSDNVTVHKNTPIDEVVKLIYDATAKAANMTKAEVTKLAREYLKK